LANSSNSRFVAALAVRYGRGLRRFLSVRLRNVQDVPDLAQEVYLRLLRVPDHEAIRNPEAYLFTVASHVLRQHLMHRSTTTAFVDITEADAAEAAPELTLPSAEEPQSKAENSQRVDQFQREVLERLPPRVRAALILHRIEGFSVKETAAQMGITRGSAQQYLVEAVRLCREFEFGGGPK
jgi:RNA polymerase sigma-19 factor, ECF subfamily